MFLVFFKSTTAFMGTGAVSKRTLEDLEANVNLETDLEILQESMKRQFYKYVHDPRVLESFAFIIERLDDQFYKRVEDDDGTKPKPSDEIEQAASRAAQEGGLNEAVAEGEGGGRNPLNFDERVDEILHPKSRQAEWIQTHEDSVILVMGSDRGDISLVKLIAKRKIDKIGAKDPLAQFGFIGGAAEGGSSPSRRVE